MSSPAINFVDVDPPPSPKPNPLVDAPAVIIPTRSPPAEPAPKRIHTVDDDESTDSMSDKLADMVRQKIDCAKIYSELDPSGKMIWFLDGSGSEESPDDIIELGSGSTAHTYLLCVDSDGIPVCDYAVRLTPVDFDTHKLELRTLELQDEASYRMSELRREDSDEIMAPFVPMIYGRNDMVAQFCPINKTGPIHAFTKGISMTVMDLARGVSLHRIMMDSIISDESKITALDVIPKFFDAIRILNNEGLQHGDVSFANAFYDDDDDIITLIDFRISGRGMRESPHNDYMTMLHYVPYYAKKTYDERVKGTLEQISLATAKSVDQLIEEWGGFIHKEVMTLFYKTLLEALEPYRYEDPVVAHMFKMYESGTSRGFSIIKIIDTTFRYRIGYQPLYSSRGEESYIVSRYFVVPRSREIDILENGWGDFQK